VAHGVVVERGLDRVSGMGEPGNLFTVHRRSLSASKSADIWFSSAHPAPAGYRPAARANRMSRARSTSGAGGAPRRNDARFPDPGDHGR
jgi:hypothetical protein